MSDPAIEEVATECGIGDWTGFVAEIQQIRRRLNAPLARWAGPCLNAALQLATHGRGWPPADATQALRRVAADPATRSPMRLAEAGPWWDETPTAPEASELGAMDQALAETGGARIALQQQARKELKADGVPVTRDAVTRRAYELLTEQTGAA